MLFSCCILKKGISAKRFKSDCPQSSLVVFCFQNTPVLLYCSATPDIFEFLQLQHMRVLDSSFLIFMYIYTQKMPISLEI